MHWPRRGSASPTDDAQSDGKTRSPLAALTMTADLIASAVAILRWRDRAEKRKKQRDDEDDEQW